MDLRYSVFGFEGTIKKTHALHVFLCYYTYIMARWLSWLERRPVTAEVRGSNPLRVAQKAEVIIPLFFY